MKKVKIKIPAKINLTLDVLGIKNGYHEISSLVASINVYDVITLTPRKEDVITVSFSGVPISCESKKSNAYFSADAFRKEFSTGGVDIKIKRGIPVAAGMGGSSADMAGVLNGLKKLYGVTKDVEFIAEKLGSDVNYMMQGGYAVISDRGEIVTPVNSRQKLYLVILLGSKGVSAGESYKEYDKLNKTYNKATDIAVKLLEEGDILNLFKALKNDLTEASGNILPEINYSLGVLSQHGTAFMTGSGSAVCAVYKTAKERNRVYKKLTPVFNEKVLKAETLLK